MRIRTPYWVNEVLIKNSGTRTDLAFSLAEEAYTTGTGDSLFALEDLWAEVAVPGLESFTTLEDLPPNPRREYSLQEEATRKLKRKRQRKARRAGRRT